MDSILVTSQQNEFIYKLFSINIGRLSSGS